MKSIHTIASLCLATLLSGCLIAPERSTISAQSPQAVKTLTNLNPTLAQSEISKGALLIDVRAPEEFTQGHLPNAVNIPHTLIKKQISLVEKNKTRSIVLYCRSGNRAEVAKKTLNELGYSSVVNGGGLDELAER